METLDMLRRKIHSARDLKSVVKTMKVIAASSIGQYERASESLSGYYKTVELGVNVYLREYKIIEPIVSEFSEEEHLKDAKTHVIVFGSDQGLVGQFNEQVCGYTLKELDKIPGEVKIWSVGERVFDRFSELGQRPEKTFPLPSSVDAITRLIHRLLNSVYEELEENKIHDVYLIHNKILSGTGYESVKVQLLPLKMSWFKTHKQIDWPTRKQPEVFGQPFDVRAALIREFIFVTIYRACTESLASEHTSRLLAMQRAEKNIEELLVELNNDYHRLRQGTIDEELFDVLSGFEALKKEK